MPLKNGIASEATISRMLSGIDETLFCMVFAEWMSDLFQRHGIHIIIDGKALRAATEKVKGGKINYILNALDAATNLVLCQMAIGEKENEISTIPTFLTWLDLEGNTVTIDAIGTQFKIMEQIIESGGNFALQVKMNQPTLHTGIIMLFGDLEKEKKKPANERSATLEPFMETFDSVSTTDYGHGRIVYRDVCSCNETSFLDSIKEGGYDFIKTVARIEQVRVPIEKNADGEDITVSKVEFIRQGSARNPKVTSGDGMSDAIQRVGFISNRLLCAKEVMKLKVDHWHIENNLHYELDEVYREDYSTATKSKVNLAMLRKFVFNIVQTAILREHPGWGHSKMLDHFSDYPSLICDLIFKPIERFA